jgi:hypothetical protein
MCAPSVTITKWVIEPNEETTDSYTAGWQFTGDLTTSSGSHTWEEPANAKGTSAPSVVATTNDDGVAAFKWELEHPTAHSTLTVSETQMPGYRFETADCVIELSNGTTATQPNLRCPFTSSSGPRTTPNATSSTGGRRGL